MITTRHSRKLEDSDVPKLDISSLIDATFLLLCFFLVNTTIQKREHEISVDLPPIPEAVSITLEPKVVTLDQAGAIYLGNNNDRIALDTAAAGSELPLLSQVLQSHASVAEALGQEAAVQLDVHDGAGQQRLIDVLNALAGAEIMSVSFLDRPIN